MSAFVPTERHGRGVNKIRCPRFGSNCFVKAELQSGRALINTSGSDSLRKGQITDSEKQPKKESQLSLHQESRHIQLDSWNNLASVLRPWEHQLLTRLREGGRGGLEVRVFI